MVALAATRRTDEQSDDLFECVTNLRHQVADSTVFHELNRAFHDKLAVASANPLFEVLVPSLSWKSAAIGFEVPEKARRRIVSDKTAIAEAVRDRDSWLAAERMRHMLIRIEEMERARPEYMAQPIIWADVDERLEAVRNGHAAQSHA